MARPMRAVLALVLVVAAACGDSTEAADVVVIGTADTEFGPVLTDTEGHTLYLLVTDRRATPTCTADCESVWAPILAGDTTNAAGDIDSGLFGTVAREGGPAQLTYNSWPLYRYRGDTAPGDIEGHGQLNVWFAIGLHGEAVGPTD